MPERDRGSTFRMNEGFAGLDTWHQPREISPRHAVRAHNVLVDKGTLQVRPPLEQDFRFTGYPSGKVYNGVDWYPPALTGVNTRVLDNTLHVDNLLFSSTGTGISPVERRQGTFVSANGYMYYLDGRRVFRSNGNQWRISGFAPGVMVGPKPNFLNDLALVTVVPGVLAWGVFPLNSTGNPALAGAAALQWNTTYQIGFTYFDEITGLESNGFTDGAPSVNRTVATGANPGGSPKYPYLMYNSAGASVRAYVRNVSAGDSFFVCYTQGRGVGLGLPSQDFAGPKIGNSESGPFLPYLNGIPEYASVGFFYKNRMFYNDLRFPNRLYYSADGVPDYVDREIGYETLDDDGGRITGMAELAGQLVIIKERGAWILNGVIFARTNASVNLGVPDSSIQKSHELYKTKVTVGCANAQGGNGAFVCAGRVYYNAISGLYRFDGLIETNVAGQIAATWREFVGDQTFGANQAVTYSQDPDREILYLVNLSIDSDRVPILAFHYSREGDSGAWTTIGPDNPADNPTCIIQVIGTQDVNAPADPDTGRPELRPTGLAFAVGSGPAKVLVMNDLRTDLPLPPFEYESGRIVLVEGLDKHWYWTRWFHNQIQPDIYERRIDVGFRTHPRGIAVYKTIDLVGVTSLQKVAEVGSDLAVLLRKPITGDSRWHPNVSIVGFGMDAEPIGQ